MKAADYQEAERFYAFIAETADMDWLQRTRSTILGFVDEATCDGNMRRLATVIDARNRIDGRLRELENPASRGEKPSLACP